MQFIIAPMDGYTDCRYRQAYAKSISLIDKAVSPFISLVRGEEVKPSHLKDWNREYNEGLDLEPQILGNEIEFFPAMARAIKNLSYKSVNWNLACPMSSVTHKKRGAGLLQDPKHIENFLEKALDCNIEMSIKIRLGLERKEEIFSIIEVANKIPLSYVAIHPRTAREKYEGSPNLDFLAQILPLIKHKIVYSGDADKKEVWTRLKSLEFNKIEAVMLGRGLIANPFLPNILNGAETGVGFGAGFGVKQEETKALFDFMYYICKYNLDYGLREISVLSRLKQYWTKLDRNYFDFIDPLWLENLKIIKDLKEYSRHIDLLWKTLN